MINKSLTHHLYQNYRTWTFRFRWPEDVRNEVEGQHELHKSLKTVHLHEAMNKRDVLLAFCKKENLKHIIIVTDSFHSRRAFFAFKKIFKSSNIKVEVSAAPNEIFNEENWWFSDLGILSYVSEPIKFVAYLLYEQNASFIKND